MTDLKITNFITKNRLNYSVEFEGAVMATASRSLNVVTDRPTWVVRYYFSPEDGDFSQERVDGSETRIVNLLCAHANDLLGL